MDYILLYVVTSKNCSETLESLDSQGWDYLLYLYQYISLQEEVKNAWEEHQYQENTKKSR